MNLFFFIFNISIVVSNKVVYYHQLYSWILSNISYVLFSIFISSTLQLYSLKIIFLMMIWKELSFMERKNLSSAMTIQKDAIYNIELFKYLRWFTNHLQKNTDKILSKLCLFWDLQYLQIYLAKLRILFKHCPFFMCDQLFKIY